MLSRIECHDYPIDASEVENTKRILGGRDLWYRLSRSEHNCVIDENPTAEIFKDRPMDGRVHGIQIMILKEFVGDCLDTHRR
jgi:hypothetical protein